MKAIILDDEVHCIKALKMMCKKYTDVQVVQSYSDSVTAMKEIRNIEADILFLDIEMPFINGFEFLQLFEIYPWKIIFTTAYDEYAVKAFKVRAVDYLLKPISKDDLLSAINLCSEVSKDQIQDRISTTVNNELYSRINKIVIPSLSGLELIVAQDIYYLKSDSNYTILKKSDGSQILVSKTLKSFENSLRGLGFLRIHNSYIVNLNAIKRYVKGDGGYVVMENEDHINVSRSRKDELLKLINNR